MGMARTPPWKRKNPARKHVKLSAKEVAAARARARRAGRRYPNLVDTMHVVKARKRGCTTERERTTKKTPAKAAR